MDNYEWNDGFDMKFGLFSVDPKINQRPFSLICSEPAQGIDLCLSVCHTKKVLLILYTPGIFRLKKVIKGFLSSDLYKVKK